MIDEVRLSDLGDRVWLQNSTEHIKWPKKMPVQ